MATTPNNYSEDALAQDDPFAWPSLDQSELAEVLNEIAAFLRRYVVFPSKAAPDVIAAWLAHTFVFDAWDATPYLSHMSPEPESGKTNLLAIEETLCRDPFRTGSVTPAGMYQRIEAFRPTFLVDEFDTAVTAKGKAKGQLQNVFNQGYKEGGSVVLGGGRTYNVFCPKVIAGLGELPTTIATRSIPVPLSKKLPSEKVETFYTRDVRRQAAPLKERLSGIQAHADYFREAPHPDMPEWLSDREREVWEPLIAIADFAGGTWPATIRIASKAHRRAAEGESDNVLLLRDIAEIINGTARRTENLFSMKSLVSAQRALDARYYQGALDTRRLGRMLGAFGIKANGHTYRDGSNGKGYEREQFRDAFTRYVR